MNKNYINVLGFLMVFASLVLVSFNVNAAEKFDVTDISYSYVSYNHPYYPNVPQYNNYYSNYNNSGYVNTYTGYVNYPYASNYVNSYYPVYSYPSNYNYYSNNVSYISPSAYVTFSWQ